jgi:hypothetical protein
VEDREGRTRDLLEGEDPLEGSLVELIVAASALSEDEFEVADVVDALVGSRRLRLVPEPRPRPAAEVAWAGV